MDSVVPLDAPSVTTVPHVTMDDVPPVAPARGDLWYDTSRGFLFIWYDDGNTLQWVVANPGRGGTEGPPGPPGIGANIVTSDTAPVNPSPGQLWWDSAIGKLFIWYQDVDSKQWVPTTPNSSGSPTVNVKMLGAVGDGIADDTAAIQRTIDKVYNGGGGVILFPAGTYKVSASTLGETYDNANTVFLASACALIQRPGVSLIGQVDRSAKITTTDATLSIIAQIAPVNCVVEGFEIYSSWTVGAAGAGMGIITFGTAGGVVRNCVNNLYRNLYIHNVGSYGIGLQNGSPVNCRIEDVDVYYTGADGIDLKSRGQLGTGHPIVYPTGNSVINCTIRNHGARVTGSCGIDIRGIWHLSGISVTDFGGDPTLEYEGIRFRTYPDPAANSVEDWLEAARYGTLVNFYIKPTPGAPVLLSNGIVTGSDDVHVANGTVNGCTNNYSFIGNTINAAKDCTFTDVSSLNALTYGCLVSTGCARNRVVNFTSKGSVTAGIRNQGDYTQIIGAACTDTTPFSIAAVALPTQIMLNGTNNGVLQIGGNVQQARINVGAPVTGNATSYGILTNPAVQSDVTASATGYGTSLSTQAAAFSTTLRHFAALQGAIGAGSTVTNQVGFYAHASLVGGTSNYGVQANLPAAAGNWNIRADGAGQNWFLGNVGIGTGKSLPAVALDIAGSVIATGTVKTLSTGVASLPSAATSAAGARAYVTDATVTTFQSVVAGGGTNAVPVYSDGTNWRIG